MNEVRHRAVTSSGEQFIAELREIVGDDKERNAVVDDLERIQKDWDAVERIILEIGFKALLHQAIAIGRKHNMVP